MYRLALDLEKKVKKMGFTPGTLEFETQLLIELERLNIGEKEKNLIMDFLFSRREDSVIEEMAEEYHKLYGEDSELDFLPDEDIDAEIEELEEFINEAIERDEEIKRVLRFLEVLGDNTPF